MDLSSPTFQDLHFALSEGDLACADRLQRKSSIDLSKLGALSVESYALIGAPPLDHGLTVWPWLEANGLNFTSHMNYSLLVTGVAEMNLAVIDWAWDRLRGSELMKTMDSVPLDFCEKLLGHPDRVNEVVDLTRQLLEAHVPLPMAAHPNDVLRVALRSLRSVSLPVIQMLLAAGADPVSVIPPADGQPGGNALHAMAHLLDLPPDEQGEFNLPNVAPLWAALVEAGADPYAISTKGETPQSLMARRGWGDVEPLRLSALRRQSLETQAAHPSRRMRSRS